MSELRGITWNHTRGFLPMLATAQRFSELHPGSQVSWEKRSLQEFADLPIEKLAEIYDLLVIDHPFSGYAAVHDVLLPLDTVLPSSFLQDQADARSAVWVTFWLRVPSDSGQEAIGSLSTGHESQPRAFSGESCF